MGSGSGRQVMVMLLLLVFLPAFFGSFMIFWHDFYAVLVCDRMGWFLDVWGVLNALYVCVFSFFVCVGLYKLLWTLSAWGFSSFFFLCSFFFLVLLIPSPFFRPLLDSTWFLTFIILTYRLFRVLLSNQLFQYHQQRNGRDTFFPSKGFSFTYRIIILLVVASEVSLEYGCVVT